jgi:hypothetical protein
MPVGLETIDTDGTRLLTEATSAGRIIGSVNVTGNGSISVPGFANGRPFAIVMPRASWFDPVTGSTGFGPRPAISGTTLSWTYPSYVSAGARTPCAIFYGVY